LFDASWSYYWGKEGLIQEGECINVGAGSAGPSITGFSEFLHKQQTWLWAP
jgi:hypothetical protein